MSRRTFAPGDPRTSGPGFGVALHHGKSAHLELGWFVGQQRRTAILLEPGEDVQPELMYLMVDYVAPTVLDLLGWLGVADG